MLINKTLVDGIVSTILPLESGQMPVVHKCKTCVRCKRYLRLENFDKKYGKGHNSHCRDCVQKAQDRVTYHDRKESVKKFRASDKGKEYERKRSIDIQVLRQFMELYPEIYQELYKKEEAKRERLSTGRN